MGKRFDDLPILQPPSPPTVPKTAIDAEEIAERAEAEARGAPRLASLGVRIPAHVHYEMRLRALREGRSLQYYVIDALRLAGWDVDGKGKQ